jgi:hypothetical protein
LKLVRAANFVIETLNLLSAAAAGVDTRQRQKNLSPWTGANQQTSSVLFRLYFRLQA